MKFGPKIFSLAIFISTLLSGCGKENVSPLNSEKNCVNEIGLDEEEEGTPENEEELASTSSISTKAQECVDLEELTAEDSGDFMDNNLADEEEENESQSHLAKASFSSNIKSRSIKLYRSKKSGSIYLKRKDSFFRIK